MKNSELFHYFSVKVPIYDPSGNGPFVETHPVRLLLYERFFVLPLSALHSYQVGMDNLP